MEIEIGGIVHHVTVECDPSSPERLCVSWGEIVRLVDARRLDVHTLSLVGVGEDVTSLEVRIVNVDDRGKLDIIIDGVLVRASVDTGRGIPGGNSGDASEGPHDILAPMPGKVVRVLVKEGDYVKAKQSVVVVEAMKMENELTTSCAGTVKSILVSEGASVGAGTVLVVVA
jgi:acetyl/propionyl-CoA carboxylase alpha subunit